eukprot:TRINITY_DN33489_c0_g1_i1.p1 TRINITY_DN33489_c0_g1~~TRINITY_DN33489_c0_g1_i1.p1  ORF type:complete len:592 (+),score=144.90 TRINITY_DN33489_c0_g1_i1:66-1841(+)
MPSTKQFEPSTSPISGFSTTEQPPPSSYSHSAKFQSPRSSLPASKAPSRSTTSIPKQDWAGMEPAPGEGITLASIQVLGVGCFVNGICTLAAAVTQAHITEQDWGLPPGIGELHRRSTAEQAGMFLAGFFGFAGGFLVAISPALPSVWFFRTGCAFIAAEAACITGTTARALYSSDCMSVLDCNWGCGHREVAAAGWLTYQILIGLGMVRACFDQGAGRGRRRGMGLVAVGITLLHFFAVFTSLVDLDFLYRDCLHGFTLAPVYVANGLVPTTECSQSDCYGANTTVNGRWPDWSDGAADAIRAVLSASALGILAAGILAYALGCRRDLCRRGKRERLKTGSKTHNCAAALLCISSVIFVAALGRLLDKRDGSAAEVASGAGALLKFSFAALGCAVAGFSNSGTEDTYRVAHKTAEERVELVAKGLTLKDLARGDGVLLLNQPALLRADAAAQLAPVMDKLLSDARGKNSKGVIVVFGASMISGRFGIGGGDMDLEALRIYLEALPNQGVAAVSFHGCGLTAEAAPMIAKYIRRSEGMREMSLEENPTLLRNVSQWASIEVAARSRGVALIPADRRTPGLPRGAGLAFGGV